MRKHGTACKHDCVRTNGPNRKLQGAAGRPANANMHSTDARFPTRAEDRDHDAADPPRP